MRNRMIVIVAVLLTSGLIGHQYVRPVVRWLGTTLDHNELALRALGWCWIALPLIVISLLFAFRPPHRGIIGTAMACVAVSSAMLTGGRRGAHRALVATDPDAQPLAYGWAAAGLTAFVMLVVTLATFAIAAKRTGRPLPEQTQQKLSRGLGAACVLLLTAGLVLALAGPLPG